LKKLVIILSFILFISNIALAQTSSTPDVTISNTQVKIIKTFPNPATTYVNLSFQRDYSRNYSIRIINSLGKKMYEAKNIPTFLTINLRAEKFYRGMYIYQLLDKNAVIIESGKIFVVN
jgi:Secretion system C-terminal sorting domain